MEVNVTEVKINGLKTGTSLFNVLLDDLERLVLDHSNDEDTFSKIGYITSVFERTVKIDGYRKIIIAKKIHEIIGRIEGENKFKGLLEKFVIGNGFHSMFIISQATKAYTDREFIKILCRDGREIICDYTSVECSGDPLSGSDVKGKEFSICSSEIINVVSTADASSIMIPLD